MTNPAQTATATWSIRPYGESFDVVNAAGHLVLLGAPPNMRRDDREERLANALLAAAAPELRTALEAAMQLSILDPAGPEWYRQAEAALNKSQGK